MGKFKKIVAGVVVAALIAGGAGYGLNRIKQGNQKTVYVTNVSSLASDYYMPSSTLDGTITTSVSQNVTVDNDMIIEQVYVNKGDRVKKGDILISFDMTLVEMELNIARLKHQKLEQDLAKAQNRLNSLQNGGPITEDDVYSSGIADDISSPNAESVGDTSSDNDDMEPVDMSYLGSSDRYFAFAMPGILLAAADDFGDSFESEEGGGEDSPADDNGAIGYYDNGASGNADEPPTEEGGFTSGDDVEPLMPEPTPTPPLDPDYEHFNDDNSGNLGFIDGNAPFVQVLDVDTEPFQGSGTKDDPYVFFVSGAKGEVAATGAFLNKMAGYNDDGTRIIKEGGYWYLLEFHQNDTVLDYADRQQSCVGYYLVNGGMLTKPVDRFASMTFSVEGASQYENGLKDPDIDPGYDPGDNWGGGSAGLSRAEAIKIQQNRIASLKLDIQESNINITKLEKKVSRQTVYSRIDGTVATVGDSITKTNSESSVFLRVKSDDGFFVKGTVGELQLEDMKEGAILKCTSYSYYTGESKQFDAEVISVSDYPTTGNNSYYWGEGNPNVSSYEFTASISDQTLEVQDGDSVTITLSEETVGNGIVLSKAFVRSENGVSYVFKDENGVLKKQKVRVEGNVDGGYSVLITGGLKRSDLIAFPYARAVQEGVKTKEVSVDKFYGY